MQPLLGCDPREVFDSKEATRRPLPAEARWLVCERRWAPLLIALHVDAERHHCDLALRNREPLRHDRHVEVADGDESIDISRLAADQIARPAAIGLHEAIEKEILALQRADNRPLQRLAQQSRQSNQQSSRASG